MLFFNVSTHTWKLHGCHIEWSSTRPYITILYIQTYLFLFRRQGSTTELYLLIFQH